MDEQVIKKPSVEGLKKAREEFKKSYKKEPSEELVQIISETPENPETDTENDDIAAKENQRPPSLEPTI